MKEYYCYVPNIQHKKALYDAIMANGWPRWEASFLKGDVLSEKYPVINYSLEFGFLVSTSGISISWGGLKEPVKISYEGLLGIVSKPYNKTNTAEPPKPSIKFEKGDIIWYRGKNDTSPHLVKMKIQEVRENVIALNDAVNGMLTNYPTWLDLSRIEIVRVEKPKN
jgi:hypothetical protein